MRHLSLLILTFVLALIAASAAAQQPPAFTYYRLPEPTDSSASRVHAVAAHEGFPILVSGQVRVEGVMRAYSITGMVLEAAKSGEFEFNVLPVAIADKPSNGQDQMYCSKNGITPKVCGHSRSDPDGGPVPTAWYDSTGAVNGDFTYRLLPTAGDSGTGEAQAIMSTGVVAGPEGVVVSGCSAPPAGVMHAATWIADSLPGPYSLEVMGDYGAGNMSRANDFTVREDSTLLAVGSAVNTSGNTLPQSWSRDQAGAWTRTPMPLPAGAAEGEANSIDTDILEPIYHFFAAAGWSEDAGAVRQAALWIQAGERLPWVAEDLGALDGYDESAALGVCIVQNEIVPDSSFDLFVVGTSYTGEDSAATLWMRDSTGTISVHDLNDLVVNDDSLDLSLRVATGVCWIPGDNDQEMGICGWGVESGGIKDKGSPADPHAFLLIHEPAAGSVSGPVAHGDGLSLAASPNPFSSGLRVSYILPNHGMVRLSVHDVLGRCVATLTDGREDAGGHSHVWSGLGSQGQKQPPGVYFLKLTFGGEDYTCKTILFR